MLFYEGKIFASVAIVSLLLGKGAVSSYQNVNTMLKENNKATLAVSTVEETVEPTATPEVKKEVKNVKIGTESVDEMDVPTPEPTPTPTPESTPEPAQSNSNSTTTAPRRSNSSSSSSSSSSSTYTPPVQNNTGSQESYDSSGETDSGSASTATQYVPGSTGYSTTETYPDIGSCQQAMLRHPQNSGCTASNGGYTISY